MTWLLCDYGQVLSLPQPPRDRAALTAAGGLPEADFWHNYWTHRAAYDRADISAAEYWGAVLGTSPDQDRIQQLSGLDVASWLHPNRECLAAAGRAADRGYRLAILSNAPADLAGVLERGIPWLERFEIGLFSCRLRLSKPDPAIYTAALERLGAAAQEVVFIDDRTDNVAAAAGLGIRAHIFTAPALFDDLPEPTSA